MVQTATDLDSWFQKRDPWNYESTLDDAKRKEILLSCLPQRLYGRTLDIGCGHGFVTRDLPGNEVLGIDISEKAITQAQRDAKKLGKTHLHYAADSLFTLTPEKYGTFDLIVITGVLYPQYIGNAHTLTYLLIQKLLKPGGILVCVHINEWYRSRFPLLLLNTRVYNYREFTHILEVYHA